MNRYWWFLIWPAVVGILIGVSFLFLKNKGSNIEFLSPLGTDIFYPTKMEIKKEVIGFLPFWNIKGFDPEKFDWSPFTQLIYFGLDIDNKGNLVDISNGEKEPGALWLESERLKEILTKAKQNNIKTLLIIKSFDNETIDSVITDSQISAKAVENISAKVSEYNFVGVNLDFEYVLDEKIASNSGQKLIEFTGNLNKKLKKTNPLTIVSFDIYANGIIHDEPYQVSELSKVCDQIILMAYDFYQMGSNKAGPVAPLRAPLGSRSIIEALQVAFRKKIPSGKLILGIPLYGYEWQTVSEAHQSNTYPRTGGLATYRRVKELISEKGLVSFWDNLSMSPWLVYEDENETKQIYFENDKSIGLKLELARQANLGGVAFWALGYEGNDTSFWQTVKYWQEKR